MDKSLMVLAGEIVMEVEDAKQRIHRGEDRHAVVRDYSKKMENIFHGLNAEESRFFHECVATAWLSPALYEPYEPEDWIPAPNPPLQQTEGMPAWLDVNSQ